jgi:hypothetical protein
MTTTRKAHRSLVLVFGAALIVAGAGFAAARTSSGPPWAEEPAEELTAPERVVLQADVEEFFGEVEGECGLEVIGESDLGDDVTLQAFGELVTALEAGQTSHMVNSVRVLLENCADHANDGLRNALYHHGLNWLRHYEHEQWLREKFANKWPDGKPGNGGGSNVEVEDTTEDDVEHASHGNPHITSAGGGPGNGNGNANGHSK